MRGFEIDNKENAVRLQVDGQDGVVRVVYDCPAEGVNIQARVTLPSGSARQSLDNLCAAAAQPESSRDALTQARILRLSKRTTYSFRPVASLVRRATAWLFASNEITNWSYDLTARNEGHMAAAIALVTKQPLKHVRAWMAEPNADEALKAHVMSTIAALPVGRAAIADAVPRWGRRLGWYAVVRALKPKLVIETGLDKGLGAVLLCAALKRNAAEGHPGRYLGTDINPNAGYLLGGPYAPFGKIAYGDSIATLKTLTDAVDILINDSDHSADYEYNEYTTLAPLFHDGSVILGDNAHVTDKLLQFATETDRKFLFVQDVPDDHFYSGGSGIGFAFR